MDGFYVNEIKLQIQNYYLSLHKKNSIMRKINQISLLLFVILAVACNPKPLQEEKETKSLFGPETIIADELPEMLTPELMWKLGRVSDIQLSPDEKTILYGVTYYNLDSNSSIRYLYSIPAEGGDPLQLTIDEDGKVLNGLWRPDGEKIGYLAIADGAFQLWEMDVNGENKKKISNIEDGINGFEYAPDMKHIIYIKDVKLDQTPNDIYPDLPLANARIITDMMYRHWNHWHDYAYSHVFYAPYNNDGSIGEAVDIMTDEPFDSPMNPWGGLEQITWSPDGKNIAYTCKKLIGKEWTISTNSEIYLYNLNDKTTMNLSENGFDGYDHDPEFSPDGRKIVWKSMEEPGFEADKERIILFDLETKEATDLSAGFDQSSQHFVWSKDGENVYFISGFHATYQIYKIDITTKKITQITSGDHNYQAFVLGENVLAGIKMTMNMPSEIFSISENTKDETQLSFTNKTIYDHIKVPKIEKRWITTTDNKQMLTWIIYPPDFDPAKKYPTLLYCQGGPQSAVSQFFSYRWNFQIMASNGYIVVAPNRRGLPSFGQEWNDQISGDYGGQNMLDYLSAIDTLALEPYVDETHLGAIGASYGGFSVFWLAGNHQKRFKAFISHCGMFNLESQYASTEEYFFVNKDLEGPYWQKPKPKSYDFSPHLFIDQWDTPILIITSMNDLRIPYTESLQAFNSAQLRGVESKLLFFPDETHFVLKPQNAVLWQREFFGWLDKWLKE
ncbi:alpha/beta fold hydrolase [candidate division KSB1 bacterium]